MFVASQRFPHGPQGHPIEVLHDIHRRLAAQPPPVPRPEVPPDVLDEARRRQGVAAAELVASFLGTIDPGRVASVPVDSWDVAVPPRRRTLSERWNGKTSIWKMNTDATTRREHDYAEGFYVYRRLDRDTSDPPVTGKVELIVFTTGQVGIAATGSCHPGPAPSHEHEDFRLARFEKLGGPARPPLDGVRPRVYVAGPEMHPGELPFYRGHGPTAGPWPGRGRTHDELDEAVRWLSEQLAVFAAAR